MKREPYPVTHACQSGGMECRPQKQALKALLGGVAAPPALAVVGPTGTGKSRALKELLAEIPFGNTYVQCDQCFTTRVLLQRALRGILETTSTGTVADAICENVDMFLAAVAAKFKAAQFNNRHILVLDRIDRIPDFRSHRDLLSGLTRVHELAGLTQLVVVFVYSTSEPRVLVANPAIPRVFFPRFTSLEVLNILDLTLELQGTDPEFRQQFLELIVNALRPSLGTDVVALQRAANKIWAPFIDGMPDNATVVRQYVKNSNLFKMDFLVDKLIPNETVKGAIMEDTTTSDTLISSYIMCAAYLASYNPPRYDMRYFSLAKTMRNKRRETKPKKSATIPARSLEAPAFDMERLLAIFHAIHPHPYEYAPTASIGRQIATLCSHNLLSKSQADPLDSRTKWKINVPWAYVQRLARRIGFDIEEFLME